MSAHTAGPWKATRDDDIKGNPCWRIDAPSVSLLAVLTYPNAGARADGIQDARLIAAAPDLLAALVACLKALDVAQERAEGDLFGVHHNQAMDAMDAASAAIAKAKGGA